MPRDTVRSLTAEISSLERKLLDRDREYVELKLVNEALVNKVAAVEKENERYRADMNAAIQMRMRLEQQIEAMRREIDLREETLNLSRELLRAYRQAAAAEIIPTFAKMPSPFNEPDTLHQIDAPPRMDQPSTMMSRVVINGKQYDFTIGELVEQARPYANQTGLGSHFIACIKILRERTKLTLKEAKEFCDEHLAHIK